MKKKLREFVVIRPALQEMLKEVLKTEENIMSDTWIYIKKGRASKKE